MERNPEMKMSLLRNACGGTLIIVALCLAAGCQQPEVSNATYPATTTPRLVELGTAACLPCALMRPGLDELKEEYAGRLQVEVIDTLWEPGAKTQYNAPLCATQLYIAASGKELYRHVGYSSKGDILAKWQELGIDLNAPAKTQNSVRPAAPQRQNPGK
jgi:thioredoxin 1